MSKIICAALAALVLASCGGGGAGGAGTADSAASASATSQAMKAKIFVPDPTLAAQQIVLASNSPVGNQVVRSVGATTDGGYTVAWLFGASTLVIQHFDSFGAKDGAETPLALTVQAPTEAAAAQAIASSSVAVLTDGSVVVEYRVSRNTDQPNGTVSTRTGVFIQRFGADGAQLLGETEVAFRDEVVTSRSPFITNLQVAALADGGFVVGWTVARFAVQSGTISTLSLQRYDNQGQPVGGAVQVGDFPALAYSIAPDAQGGFTLYTSQLDVTFTPLFSVTHYDATMAATPIVAPGPGAAFLLPLEAGYVLFTSDAAGSSRQMLDSQGNPVGQPTQLAFMPLDARELADGSYVVFWRTSGNFTVFSQRFAADGSPMGDTLTLQTDGLLPQVAALADVGFALAWSAAGVAVDTDVFTQRFIEVLSNQKKVCLDDARGLKGQERKAFMNACLGVAGA